jgi:hypothetical protein
MQHLEIDLMSIPLPSRKGHRYILSVTDVFTSYAFLRALKSKEPKEVASKLWKIFTQYGLPSKLQSDNGGEFKNEDLESICKFFKVEKSFTLPYRPQVNGKVEKLNGDIKIMLAKITDHQPQDWNEFLPWLEYCYNTTPNRRTGYNPAFLMYGRHFNAFANFNLVDIPTAEPTSESIKRLVDHFDQVRHHIYFAASENTKRYQEKQREESDHKKTLKEPFATGTYVLARDPLRKNGLDARYKFPGIIIGVGEHGSYRVQHRSYDGSNYERTYDATQLRVTTKAVYESTRFNTLDIDAIESHKELPDGSYIYNVRLPNNSIVQANEDLIDPSWLQDYWKAENSQFVDQEEFLPPINSSEKVDISPNSDPTYQPKATPSKAVTTSNTSDDSSSDSEQSHSSVQESGKRPSRNAKTLAQVKLAIYDSDQD